MPVEKLISFHIERQFPAIYREDGQELIQLVKEYYKFLETNTEQSLYNGRRLFEYKDIDTTLESMLIFFKKKYLADLPFDGDTVRIVVKNILGLYRRKGTQGGLELFFNIFYNESIKVYYPAKDMFRPSDSEWKKGTYLQMMPNNGLFTSTKTTQTYTYKDLIGKQIIGASSRVKATVDKINFVIVGNTITPILFINDETGSFIGKENIISEFSGIPISFGVINGSLTSIAVDDNFGGSIGNEIGDIVTFRTDNGFGAKGLVTAVTENFSGFVRYDIEDGGWGYSVDTTKLLVSNQTIFLDNEGGKFQLLEALEDDSGNRGIVIGQSNTAIGLKMDVGDEFTNTSIITTMDRDINVNITTLSPLTPIRILEKNDSSPGPLYPETLDTDDVILAEIDNEESVSLIFDLIGDYANVALNAANYNDPPAEQPMSGFPDTDPITISTPLNEAFDLTPIDIGRIVRFDNINPGTDYENDVFAIAYDTRISLFKKRNQLVTLSNMPATISVGSLVTQESTNGKVVSINNNTLTITPYTYAGFNNTSGLIFKGVNYGIVGVSTDFNSPIAGFNATINAVTSFGVGKITNVSVIDSGYGYTHNTIADIIDADGELASKGTISALGPGSTEGYWASLDSHINGYVLDGASLTYYDSGKRVQDSNYYQEFSYEILSTVNLPEYEESLREIVHVAGTKVFGRFNLEDVMSTPISSRIIIDAE
jgi:hypothetical protein